MWIWLFHSVDKYNCTSSQSKLREETNGITWTVTFVTPVLKLTILVIVVMVIMIQKWAIFLLHRLGKGSGYKIAQLESLTEDETLFVGGKEIQVSVWTLQFQRLACFSSFIGMFVVMATFGIVNSLLNYKLGFGCIFHWPSKTWFSIIWMLCLVANEEQ